MSEKQPDAAEVAVKAAESITSGEAMKMLSLSTVGVMAMASLAQAEGASDDEVIACLTEQSTQNIQMVTDRFPELNQKIQAFSAAANEVMRESESANQDGQYALGELKMNESFGYKDQANEVAKSRVEHLSWVFQMHEFCRNELLTLEVAIATAEATGSDTSALEAKQTQLEGVVENLAELKEGYRDM